MKSAVLYILRNFEMFENSIKIHFLIHKTGANFNNFQGNSTSAKAPIYLINVSESVDCVRSKQLPTLTAKNRFWYVVNLKYVYST